MYDRKRISSLLYHVVNIIWKTKAEKKPVFDIMKLNI